MLGMIPGNGHPYSWSAIINGFDKAAMEHCPYQGIRDYIGAQPAGTVGIPEARVTHVWTDDADEVSSVATAARIPHIAKRPEDVIGEVDAVMIATDDGADHIRRVRPFVEAGLPVFVDKPLATTPEDLETFIQWQQQGARILSSSGLRYAVEVDAALNRLPELGELRWLCGITIKTWERYGIHVLEPLFRMVGPGFTSVRLEGTKELEVAHLTHKSGVQLTITSIYDGGPSFGTFQLCGTAGQMHFQFKDTYAAFRAQLVSFIDFVRTGRAPHAFVDTVEMMQVLIAGLRSRTEDSSRIPVAGAE